MKHRNHFIDDLRGIAIIIMILTHVTAYYPSDTLANAIWNWSNFSVPIFIFCSAYLFFQKSLHTSGKGFSYLKKRVVRLLVPYYTFLLFFLPMLFFVRQETVTINYVLQSILLIGGVDINWLVLLFLMFALLMPIFTFLYQKNKPLFLLGFILSTASTICLLWYTPPVSYKYSMWLPWSLLLYFTFFYQKFEHKKMKLIILFVITSMLFLASYDIRLFLDKSVVLIHNKYPPNIMYLSYGMSLFLLISFLLKRFPLASLIAKPLHFFSIYSYQLYFIHYLFLIIIAALLPQLKLPWYTFFIILIGATVVTQLIIIQLQKMLKTNRLR